MTWKSCAVEMRNAILGNYLKFSATSAWNKLPREIHELRTLAQFKDRTFTYLMNIDRANPGALGQSYL